MNKHIKEWENTELKYSKEQKPTLARIATDLPLPTPSDVLLPFKKTRSTKLEIIGQMPI